MRLVRAEFFEVDKLQRGRMRRFQIDERRVARFERFLPSG